MKKLFKDKVFVIMLILLILVSFALVSVIIRKPVDNCKKECKCTKDSSQTEEKTTETNTNNDKRKWNYKIITDLVESTDYEDISVDDSRIKYILTAMDNLVYKEDIGGYTELSKADVISAVSKLIKDDDIYDVDDNKEPDYSYGYIKKETLNNYASTLFLGEEYLSLPIQDGMGLVNASPKFLNATVVSKTNDAYYFRFYGKEGTAGPHATVIYQKAINAKEFTDSILIEEKVFYFDYNDVRKIYSDRDKTNVIAELDIDLNDYEKLEKTTIDINDYLDKAGTIYIVLDKKDGNFYFKMSQLYYEEEIK